MSDLQTLLAFTSPVVPVTVNEKEFFVTSMNGAARERIQELWGKGKSPMSYAIACCLCDKNGKKYDPTGARHGEFKKVDSIYLDALFESSMSVSGLGSEDPEDASPNPIDGSGSS